MVGRSWEGSALPFDIFAAEQAEKFGQAPNWTAARYRSMKSRLVLRLAIAPIFMHAISLVGDGNPREERERNPRKLTLVSWMLA